MRFVRRTMGVPLFEAFDYSKYDFAIAGEAGDNGLRRKR
jgi:hypothetical protein